MTFVTEVMVFAAMYAVAFAAHVAHGVFTRGEAHDVETTHRVALYGAVMVKAFHAAFHDYMLHFAEAMVHVVGH